MGWDGGVMWWDGVWLGWVGLDGMGWGTVRYGRLG